MWKNKKRARDTATAATAATTGADDDDEADDDGYRAHYAQQHSGVFSLEILKASTDYADRVECRDVNPKKKYAVCFGYLGSHYQGLQINPGATTIESVLEKALYLSGGIEDCNYENPQKLGWTRAARTDRGVHAIAQLCAMKLRMPLGGEEQFRTHLNKFLPSDIRAFSVKRVTKSFNSKIACSGRRYQYLFPTYILENITVMNEYFTTEKALSNDKYLESIREKCLGYRISPVKLTLLRETLKTFEGTKKYHNFTSIKQPNDPSAQRYITSFTCSDPFIQGDNHVEWVCISIEGQSFLLNQIRKMVALVFEVVRGATPADIFDTVFSPNKVDILMAPGLGLYLDKLFFDTYNKRLEYEGRKQHSKPKPKPTKDADGGDDEDGVDMKLEFDAEGSATAEMMRVFRRDVVWEHIVEEERLHMHFLKYLEELFGLKNYYAPKPFNIKQA